MDRSATVDELNEHFAGGEIVASCKLLASELAKHLLHAFQRVAPAGSCFVG